jgi:plastocyanin domain-containing protein
VTFLEIVVLILGLALIGGELWYFLAPPKRDTPALRGGVQEIRVVVKDGYHPDTILVESGRPVRLQFFRDETADCSAQLQFETLGIQETLEPFRTTTVEFTPTTPGDYPFRCGKGVLRGRVVAQVGREAARVNLGRGHQKHG